MRVKVIKIDLKMDLFEKMFWLILEYQIIYASQIKSPIGATVR